jgi:hypothetical protein
MQAQFVREVDGDVTFLKDGKLVTMPLDKLSDEDQKFIRDAELNKKVEETTPPAGAPRTVDNSSLPTDSAPITDSKSSLTKQKTVAEERTWRDLRGKPQVGKFVRIHQGFVVISSGSRAIRMPFNNLSRPDREYIRELLAARGESGQLPPDRRDDPAPAGPEHAPAEAAPSTEPPSEQGPVAPPQAESPAVPRGGQTAGRAPAGARVPTSGNDRLTRMQEENQKQMDASHERNQKMMQQSQERARQSLERLKPNLAPQQQESPQDLVGSCSNCKKQIKREESGSMKCPHCGVIWEYEIDEFGRKKEIPGAKEAIAATGGWTAGWKWEDRHYVKLFTRIIIPLAVMLFAAIGAALRGKR